MTSNNDNKANAKAEENDGDRDLLQGCRSIKNYRKINVIDEGTYVRAEEINTKKIYALKKVKMHKDLIKKEGFPITSVREVNLLLSLDHPNVLKVKEVVVDQLDDIFMVMGYMEHDVKSVMDSMSQPFRQSEVKQLMLQLLSGVKYLHDNWILHRDLKSSNLLFNNKGILQIADFGLARKYGSPLGQYTPYNRVVTLWYRAPELLLGTPVYSTAIDMWSVGCLFAELLTKKPLFPGKSEVDQFDKIVNVLGAPNTKIWPGYNHLPNPSRVRWKTLPYSQLESMFPRTSFSGGPYLSANGLDLLSKLLCYDPEKRISAEEALNHPYFQEPPLPQNLDMMPTFPPTHDTDAKKRKHSPDHKDILLQQLADADELRFQSKRDRHYRSHR